MISGPKLTAEETSGMTKHSEAIAAKSWLNSMKMEGRGVGKVLVTDNGDWHPWVHRKQGASEGQRDLYLEAF